MLSPGDRGSWPVTSQGPACVACADHRTFHIPSPGLWEHIQGRPEAPPCSQDSALLISEPRKTLHPELPGQWAVSLEPPAARCPLTWSRPQWKQPSRVGEWAHGSWKHCWRPWSHQQEASTTFGLPSVRSQWKAHFLQLEESWGTRIPCTNRRAPNQALAPGHLSPTPTPPTLPKKSLALSPSPRACPHALHVPWHPPPGLDPPPKPLMAMQWCSIVGYSLKQKWCFMKIVAVSANSSVTSTASRNNSCTSGLPQMCFLPTSHFLTQRIKKLSARVSRFNKTKNVYCFIKDILRGNWLFLFLTKVMVKKKHSDNWGPLLPLPWFLLGCQQFSSPLLSHTRANVNIVKKATNICVSLWKSIWPPERVLGALRDILRSAALHYLKR